MEVSFWDIQLNTIYQLKQKSFVGSGDRIAKVQFVQKLTKEGVERCPFNNVGIQIIETYNEGKLDEFWKISGKYAKENYDNNRDGPKDFFCLADTGNSRSLVMDKGYYLVKESSGGKLKKSRKMKKSRKQRKTKRYRK